MLAYILAGKCDFNLHKCWFLCMQYSIVILIPVLGVKSCGSEMNC